MGKLSKNITVYSNDPKNPRFQLKMSGMVEVLADFQPRRVFFRNVAKGTTQTQTVEVVGKLADKVKLSKVSSAKPEEWKVEVEQADGKQRLKITFTAPNKEGRFSSQVSAQTGLDKPAEIKLSVSAQVTGDLVADKSYVMFTTFNEKNPPKHTVSVQSLSGAPFKVTKVEDTAGHVSGTFSKAEKDWKVELTLTRKPEIPRGKIQIHTDRADQRILSLNYSVRGSRQRLPANLRRLSGKAGGTIKQPLFPARLAKPHKPGKAPASMRTNPRIRKLPLKIKRSPTTATTPPKP